MTSIFRYDMWRQVCRRSHYTGLWSRWETVWLPAAIVVSGPTVLALMWMCLDWPAGIEGFPAFRSGTVGDAVLLPAIAGAASSISARCPVAHHERRWVLALAVIGGAVGLIVQWMWWSDPNPPSQWGIVESRHFSIAGWWHAGFFVVMAGLLAALAIRMLLRVRGALHTGDASVLRAPAMTLLITAILSFCGLLLLDAQPSSTSNSSRASLVALAMSVSSLVLVSASLWRRYAASVGVAAASGLLGAVVSVLVCLEWPPTLWQLILFGVAIFAPAAANHVVHRRSEESKLPEADAV